MDEVKNRGQVIIIGGVLVAGVILGTAVVLNSLLVSQEKTAHGSLSSQETLLFLDYTTEALRSGMSGVGGTPSEALDEYENYTESYEATVRGRSVRNGVGVSIGEPDTETTAWVAGQKRVGEFVNATGDGDWIAAESVSEVHHMEINLSVKDTAGDSFVVNMTESSSFGGVSSTFNNGWRTEASVNAAGDTLTVETEELGVSTDTETYGVSDRDHVVLDFIEAEVGGEPSSPLGSIDMDDVGGVRVESGSGAEGTYDTRFDDGTDLFGPCPTEPCRGNRDDSLRYAVGAVHEVEGVTVTYDDGSFRHNQTIDSLVLDTGEADPDAQDVYGSPYLDVAVSGNNSPVDEGDDVEIDYEVENTGDKDSGTSTLELLLRENGKETVVDDVQVSPDAGNTDTGTLSWGTSGGDSGTRTLFLRTEDTASSVRVAVKDTSTGPVPPGPVGFAGGVTE